MRRDRSGTIAAASAFGLAMAALVAAPALGAAPLKDVTYRGSLSGGESKIAISFRVSPGGAQVEGVGISALPIYCSGNGPPGTPGIVFQKARITAAGTFSTTGKDMIASGPLKGSVAATLALSGTFAADGRVHGTITTSYSGPARSCGGHSSYTARA